MPRPDLPTVIVFFLAALVVVLGTGAVILAVLAHVGGGGSG